MRRHEAATVALAALLLAGCSTESQPQETQDATPHGFVQGAEEVPEAQLGAVIVGDDEISALDLLSEETASLADVESPSTSRSDGRFVYTATADGLAIVDSGVWTVPHGDHVHHYRAEPGVVGDLPGVGGGGFEVGSSASRVAIADATGSVTLLDREALADGQVEVLATVDVAPHHGAAAPLGDGIAATTGDAVQVFGADGTAGESLPCTAPTGFAQTRAGIVFGCAEGAVIADEEGIESVPYPADAVAPQALDLDARGDRPTLAGLAGDQGVWMLDARERAWSLLPAHGLVAVTAVDDEASTVLGIGVDGALVVLDGTTGAEIARSAPLVAAAAAGDGISLAVEGGRAYVASSAEGVLVEVDYADGARVTRTFEIGHAHDVLLVGA